MVASRSGRCRAISSSFPADADSVVRMRGLIGALAARADADRECVEAIRLAVSEAATNAVLHAYRERPGEPGEIHLTATVLDDELTVLISDDGCGPAAPSRSTGLGWGWKLIADACDALTIAQRGTGGTEMRMRFHLVSRRKICA